MLRKSRTSKSSHSAFADRVLGLAAAFGLASIDDVRNQCGDPSSGVFKLIYLLVRYMFARVLPPSSQLNCKTVVSITCSSEKERGRGGRER
jgi:hypothetical protein